MVFKSMIDINELVRNTVLKLTSNVSPTDTALEMNQLNFFLKFTSNRFVSSKLIEEMHEIGTSKSTSTNLNVVIVIVIARELNLQKGMPLELIYHYASIRLQKLNVEEETSRKAVDTVEQIKLLSNLSNHFGCSSS